MFRVGRWVRDRLLVFDLGYFRYQLFDCIDSNGGHFISRLKKSGNPLIVASNLTQRGRAVPVVGGHLLEVVADLKRQTLDVTVQVSFKRQQYAGKHSGGRSLLRVVGVKDSASGKYHLYVTNIPTARLRVAEIAQVYATRWQIELLFKELKSHYRIEDPPRGKREIVEALVYAAVLKLVVSRRLLAAVRAKLRSKRDRLPEQRWARVFALSQDLLALALGMEAEARRLEQLLTVTILHEAIDPNAGRRRLLEAIRSRSHLCARNAPN